MDTWMSLDMKEVFERFLERDYEAGVITEKEYDFISYHLDLHSDDRWVEVSPENLIAEKAEWTYEEAVELANGLKGKGYVFEIKEDEDGFIYYHEGSGLYE